MSTATGQPRASRRYDLAILGGGTAGIVAGLVAAGVGARVVLVERREQTGGDCLWTGCVPSKSLIAAAALADRMRHADAVGLTPIEPEIDFPRVMAHVHAARRAIEPQDSVERLRREGVEVVHGDGRFSAPGRIAVDGRTLRFRAALIATGSRPTIPPVEGLADPQPLTNETVWDIEELPRRLVVLGGGPVGAELAQAFARLGSRVTVVELSEWLLSKEEPEARALITERFAAECIDVRLGTRAVRVRRTDDGGRELVVEHAGEDARLRFDRVLAATGRTPETAGLGLEAVGVEVDANGAVKVDERLRTTARGVFAAGDVTGTLPFTHVAGHHGRTVVANALFHARGSFTTRAVPWVIFTDPEVGRVGLTEARARERFGDGIRVARKDYAELDRAVTAGEPYGFAKLVGDRRGRLVGATVAAPAGGEATAELAARVAARDTIAAVSRQVHAYPTFTEGPARAADEDLRARLRTKRVRRVVRPALAVMRLLERTR